VIKWIEQLEKMIHEAQVESERLYQKNEIDLAEDWNRLAADMLITLEDYRHMFVEK
jgi:hypothetical protein